MHTSKLSLPDASFHSCVTHQKEPTTHSNKNDKKKKDTDSPALHGRGTVGETVIVASR